MCIEPKLTEIIGLQLHPRTVHLDMVPMQLVLCAWRPCPQAHRSFQCTREKIGEPGDEVRREGGIEYKHIHVYSHTMSYHAMKVVNKILLLLIRSRKPREHSLGITYSLISYLQ